MREFRIQMKFIEIEGSPQVYDNVWHVEEKVRIHYWPWPKTWVTRVICNTPADAVDKMNQYLALDGI